MYLDYNVCLWSVSWWRSRKSFQWKTLCSSDEAIKQVSDQWLHPHKMLCILLPIMQSFMKFLQVWLINHVLFNIDVVQHGQFSLNCGWKQVVKYWYRQQFSWKQIASVVCTCFVVLNQLCKDEHERFCNNDFIILKMTILFNYSLDLNTTIRVP